MKKFQAIVWVLAILFLQFASTPIGHAESSEDIPFVFDSLGVLNRESQDYICFVANSLLDLCGTSIVVVVTDEIEAPDIRDYAKDVFSNSDIINRLWGESLWLFLSVNNNNDDYYVMLTSEFDKIISTSEINGLISDFLLPGFQEKNYAKSILDFYDEASLRIADAFGVRQSLSERIASFEPDYIGIAEEIVPESPLFESGDNKADHNTPSPTEDFYVLDEANVLEYETEGLIVFTNDLLKKACGAEVVVVAVESTNGIAIDDYTLELAQAWNIGDSIKHNGFVLVLAVADDNYYAIAADGLSSVLTNGKISSLLNQYLEPDFARKEYDAGVNKVFEQVINEISDIYSVNISTKDGQILLDKYLSETDDSD